MTYAFPGGVILAGFGHYDRVYTHLYQLCPQRCLNHRASKNKSLQILLNPPKPDLVIPEFLFSIPRVEYPQNIQPAYLILNVAKSRGCTCELVGLLAELHLTIAVDPP